MYFLLIANSWILVCATTGFLWGVYQFFRNKGPLYAQIIVCGIACMMIDRLFQVIYILTQGEMKLGFDVALLSLAGAFLFLISANYGQIDSLLDDGDRRLIPTRITALIAPVIMLGLYSIPFFAVDVLNIRVGLIIMVIVVLPCCYYSLKHIIIFDVNDGLVKPLRPFNTLVLIYSVFVCLEFITEYLNMTYLYMAAAFIQGLIIPFLVPVVRKGVNRWTI